MKQSDTEKKALKFSVYFLQTPYDYIFLNSGLIKVIDSWKYENVLDEVCWMATHAHAGF